MSAGAEAKLAPMPWMKTPGIKRVIKALDGESGAPRFVGGCVRDALAGRAIKDIDLATPLMPEEVVSRLEAANIKVIPTGIAHGTVTAIASGEVFEITTLRVDLETDGRFAVVGFTDNWEADAARRDLTINAMSLDPSGNLYDPFGGREDLKAGRIRFVGDAKQRIEEDYLRLLRLFRFHAWYGMEPLDEETLNTAKSLAPGLRRLSGERVRDELLRLLGAPDPVPALRLMVRFEILGVILPEIFNGAALERFLLLEPEMGGTGDPLMRLAGLLAEKPNGLSQRLRLSGEQREKLHMIFSLSEGFAADLSDLAFRRALQHNDAALVMASLLRGWAHNDLPPKAERENWLTTAKTWEAKDLPVGGKDLLAMGLEPGPEIGRYLAALEEWWLAGDRQASRAQCLKILEHLVASNA